ncbi:MAG: hypothetical protein ACI4ME_08035 [Aristaeellaceae bacterium]
MAIMAGLLCALAGMKHASSLKSNAVRLKRWGQILPCLALILREGTLSIPEALCAAADGTLPPDRLLHDMAVRISSNPMTSLTDAFLACCGECPEQPLLTRMFVRLGHGTKESRCLAVEQSAEEMAVLAKSAEEKAEKDVKLWQTLGFIGGACLTILLL